MPSVPENHHIIAAIETRYAGCRFRSRLEARWAVAFDHMGIKWEYEPQCFEVTDRLNLLGGMDQTWGYLPDFWLPELELWVEVKGAFDTDEAYRKFLSAAAFLSSNGGGGCHDNGGHDVVILGPIPRPERRSAWPIRLHMHKGLLLARGWAFGLLDQDPHDYYVGNPFRFHYGEMASDSGEIGCDANGDTPDLLGGWPEKLRPAIVEAYTAARSARFEHGESGSLRTASPRSEPKSPLGPESTR